MNLLTYAYKQPNSWTCGPAVARLILGCFGRKKTIKEVIRELGIGKEGTANKDLKRIFRKYDIKFQEKERASLEDIKKKIKTHLIIVAYWIPRNKEAHYSIVQKVGSKRVYFHDTWFGINHSYSVQNFLKNWWDDEATHWFLAVKKPID